MKHFPSESETDGVHQMQLVPLVVSLTMVQTVAMVGRPSGKISSKEELQPVRSRKKQQIQTTIPQTKSCWGRQAKSTDTGLEARRQLP